MIKEKRISEQNQSPNGNVPTVKDIRKILTQSPLLKKSLDKKIHGPISKKIFKEIGDRCMKIFKRFVSQEQLLWVY